MKHIMCDQRYVRGVIIASLALAFIMASGVVQAKNSDSHQFQGKFYDRAHSAQLFDVKQVNNGHTRNKRYRFGDHYRVYKKKYRDNKNYPNKYYYPPHYPKRQYHSKRSYNHHVYNYGHNHKSLKHRRHYGFKANYWSEHKRHGYQYKRVGRHHYYYNNHGFYFPGLGLIKHGHQHNNHCDDWHFSALLASSILLSIYHK